jgi:soluble lytic murein transglycosylase-like protein
LKRAHVILLAILSLGLTTDGVTSSVLTGAPNAAELPEGDDVERISEIVQRHNPTLSPSEGDRIGHAVVRSASKNGLDPSLVTAVLIVESGARPWARSEKGAVGLMQVMPYMVEDMRLAGNLMTIESNVEAGCIILADNIRRLGEDDGISAYFWGSNIRGVAYLDRVRAARARLQGFSES